MRDSMDELIFRKIKNVKAPRKAHRADAGYDFFIPEFPDFKETTIFPQENLLVPSGIKALVPFGYALVAFAKSGVCTKTGLIPGASVVDSGYTGEIHLHLINSSLQPVTVYPGQKIIQFLLLPVGDAKLREVDEKQWEIETAWCLRGEGGFGSTGE
jgi:dUTP pyrophosphatase